MNKNNRLDIGSCSLVKANPARVREIAAGLVVGAILASAQAIAEDKPAGQAAATPPPVEKPSTWESSAAVGLTLTSGNSDNLMFTAKIGALRKWDKNELSLGADGAYGESDGTKNTETLHGFVQYNRLFTERFYGYARADASHDGIADVDYRVILSPGVGYYAIKDPKIALKFEAGPGAVLEKVGGNVHNYFTLRLAQRFDYKFSKTARLWQSVEYLPQVDDWNNFLLNAEIGVEADLTKKLALQTYLQDTYDNVPAPGRKNNDLKLVAGIALKF